MAAVRRWVRLRWDHYWRMKLGIDSTRPATTHAIDTRQFSVEQQIREIHNEQVVRDLFKALADRDETPPKRMHG